MLLPQMDGSSDNWSQIEDPETGQTYFYNELTGETQWEPPDSFAAQRDDALVDMSTDYQISTYESPARADDWQEYTDEDGRLYYYNALTGETSWERPAPML
mmetsp:Transcript_42232/g.69356  ORF Transcript_42232/g.69356 Transcript_42232/m.69356 type:complete len:101 (+) Transcript_42232:39-341(+)